VSRYLAVATFQCTGMRWKKKKRKRKSFPKRSHQWKRIIYFMQRWEENPLH
jgi:hypothetical protein